MIPRALPSKVVFELISQKAANGDYTENPFNFQHFTLSEVTLKVNGVEVYGTSLKLNFGKSKNLSMAYVRLFFIYSFIYLLSIWNLLPLSYHRSQ
jgi:hypothetical protein